VDKMSLVSIIFVSFPEELLIVATTMALAGYKDLLNFRQKENLFKLLISASLMVAASVILRSVLPSLTMNAIIMLPVFYSIIILVYRHRPAACIPGFILSMLVLTLGDALFTSLLLKILNLSLKQVHQNDFLRILVYLPKDAVQILVLVFILNKKNINLQFKKLSLGRIIQLALFSLLLVQSMFSIEIGWKNIDRDFNTILILLINVLVVILFLLWVMLHIFRLEKKSEIDKKIYNFELERIKKLLQEGQTSHALKLIDLTIKQRGKKDEAQNF
jgi:hypothetical protein